MEFLTWNGSIFSQGATPQEALQVGTDIVAIKTTGTDATLAPFSNYTLNLLPLMSAIIGNMPTDLLVIPIPSSRL
jgi:hypothetical protein